MRTTGAPASPTRSAIPAGRPGNSGTDTNQFQLLDDPRLHLNEGATDTDRRHNFVLSGRMEVPKTGGLTISGVYRYLSGAPMTIEDQNFDLAARGEKRRAARHGAHISAGGTEPEKTRLFSLCLGQARRALRVLAGRPAFHHGLLDQNGELFDPLPPGEYCGSGLNSICVDNEGGRNGAIGPDFHQADVRVGYRFRAWHDATIDTYVDFFNVFNTANFVNPSGDRRQTNFLMLQSLRGGGFPRQAQIGVRLGF